MLNATLIGALEATLSASNASHFNLLAYYENYFKAHISSLESIIANLTKQVQILQNATFRPQI